ncbi:hypothetical protein VTO73DRAFT_4219 [Trametes versicolor]
MADPSLLAVMLLILFAESLLYGAFCVLFLISMSVLVYRRRRDGRSWVSIWMSAIVTTMFILAGVYLALDIRHLKVAFVDHSATLGGPFAYLQQQGSDPFRNVHPYIFGLMTLMGDGFMIYRVFVVWNCQLISLVVPALLLLGDMIAGGIAGLALIKGSRTYYSITAPGARTQLIAYLSMTLLTNIVTTSLLLGRLWWHDRTTKKYLSEDAYDSVPWQVMKTIVQSQAAYSAGVVFNLATYAARSNLVLVTNAILPPLIGISFTIIITRIGLSEVLGDTTNTRPASSLAFGNSAATRSDPELALPNVAVTTRTGYVEEDESETRVLS